MKVIEESPRLIVGIPASRRFPVVSAGRPAPLSASAMAWWRSRVAGWPSSYQGVQFGGAGSSIRSGAPTGTMNVTYVSAGSAVLFSATCTAFGSSKKP
jgi:hypothetical protein